LNRLLSTLAQITPDEINLPNKGGISDDVVHKALQMTFGVAGAVAVLIIVIAGFQYVMSTGDPQSTNKAKNTILYALIGLVICVFAFSIVTFVVTNL
jgi:hypothetical protein